MNSKEYLRELEVCCGSEAGYFNQMKAEGGPEIGIVGFDNYPVKGHFTYFTHGLHLLNKPEWIAGRPEYFITIDQPDRSFAMFFGYLISAFAFEKIMGWNTLIGVGDSDAVEGYPYRRVALGPPCYLGWRDYRFETTDGLPIHLGMGYFISDGDFEKAAQTGFGYLQQKLDEDQDYWRKLVSRLGVK